MRIAALLGLVLTLPGGPSRAFGQETPPAPPAQNTSCLACHGSTEVFDAETVQHIVESFHTGVHAEVGLSCHDCHGGNPDPALADDMESAMSPTYADNPYRGAPKREQVPQFCGRCHSNPTYMKRYRPDARVDQEQEYWTSQHGKVLRQGDTRVATCIDCHGVHGILRPTNPESSVYPTRVAQTCNHCHGDPDHMRGFKLPNGEPLPVDQFARWSQSVHANAMFQKGDLSAPTCNDCHGNHGAAPPGLDSVAFVCGQCHGREAKLFRASAKHEGFERHNEFLADAGGEGCVSCHEPPDPASTLRSVHSFSECATCHSNHSIMRPTVALLAPLPETPCAFCHESPENNLIPEPEKTQVRYSELLSSLLAQPEARGLEGEQLFDWLVDRAVELPTHTVAGAAKPGEPPVLRPEFSRLFQKFRIGKIHYTFNDPATGQPVTDRVRRCTDCHAEKPQLADQGVGLAVARDDLQGFQQVTAATGRAERMLLTARRGGVEVRGGLGELDQAVDSQIELQVLVHDFSAGPDAEFTKKQAEGMEHARAALSSAQSALKDLQYRRRGLALSLAFVVLVLVGLALKIRQLSA